MSGVFAADAVDTADAAGTLDFPGGEHVQEETQAARTRGVQKESRRRMIRAEASDAPSLLMHVRGESQNRCVVKNG